MVTEGAGNFNVCVSNVVRVPMLPPYPEDADQHDEQVGVSTNLIHTYDFYLLFLCLSKSFSFYFSISLFCLFICLSPFTICLCLSLHRLSVYCLLDIVSVCQHDLSLSLSLIVSHSPPPFLLSLSLILCLSLRVSLCLSVSASLPLSLRPCLTVFVSPSTNSLIH